MQEASDMFKNIAGMYRKSHERNHYNTKAEGNTERRRRGFDRILPSCPDQHVYWRHFTARYQTASCEEGLEDGAWDDMVSSTDRVVHYYIH